MILSLIAGTIVLRPYVFIFLLAYFIACSLHLGFKRAVLFCLAGYFIAWLSEYSSINNGFPYGRYSYIESTRGRELWVLGVPFMDSVSYVFLAYASYSVALAVTAPILFDRRGFYLLETAKIRASLKVRLLSAIFLVCLDIIVDPVALRGSRWFLGQIYFYPEGGGYFGVPLSNFAGWFVVGFGLICVLQAIDRALSRTKDYIGFGYPWRYLAGPAIYIGVLAFNLSVTFWIGEYTLGSTGLFIVLLPGVAIYYLKRLKVADITTTGKHIAAHRRDYPEAVIPEFPG